VPEENFWTSWRKGRLTEADTLTIRLGATLSGPTSAHLHHPPIFLQAGCPSCRPTNSVKALKATTSHLTRNRSFWRTSSEPISWLVTEETKANTIKQTFTGNTKVPQDKLLSFYGHTAQPVLAGTPVLRTFAEAKFYSPHALADGNKCTQIREKMMTSGITCIVSIL